MSETKLEIPDFVKEKVSIISQKTNTPVDKLMTVLNDIMNDPLITEDKSFEGNDHEKWRYASTVLFARYVSRPPMKEYDVVPIGCSIVRLTKKSQNEMASLFAFVKTQKGTGLKRIVLQTSGTDILKNINFFNRYKVDLGEFKSGDLSVDDRSKFENPEALSMKKEDIANRVNAKKTTIAEALNNQSTKGSDGYTIETDWRVVRGIITSSTSGTNEDSGEYGRYTIVDESVGEEAKVTPEGAVIRALTCWINPILMKYERDSEVDIYGTINKSKKTGEPQMNAFMILPVHARYGQRVQE